MAIKLRTLVAGVVLAGIAVVNAAKVADQNDWLPAQGTVGSVTEQCKMEATERGIMTKTTYSSEIDCELVDAFEAHHADKSWRVTHVFTGSVRVTSTTAKATTVEMKLPRTEGRDPKRGDTLALIQDPANPARVELTSTAASFPLMTAGFGIAGLLLVWLGLGSPFPRGRSAREGLPEMDRGTAYPDAAEPVPAYQPPQPTYQPAVTDHSRARTNQSVVTGARKTFGRRGA